MRMPSIFRTTVFITLFFSVIGINECFSQTDTLPQITVTASVIDFGNTPLGTSRQRSFLIINSTDTALTLVGDVSALSQPFTIDSGGGSFVLDSGTFKRVYISFLPTSLGSFFDSIVIASNTDSAAARVVVYISGKGFIPDTVGRLSVTPASLDFGVTYTGFSKPLEITMKNITNTRIKITGNVINAHPPFYVTDGLGNFQLDSGQSKRIIVQSAPDQVGTFIDSIIIKSSVDTIVIPLKAIVKSADILKPQMTLSAPDTINFGQMSPNSAQTLELFFSIKNTSDSERVLSVKLLEPHGFFSLVGPTDLSLDRFAIQQFRVQFTPKAPGDFFDSIIVISNTPEPRVPIYLKAKVIPTGNVNSEGSDEFSFTTFPNPARDVVVLQFHSDIIERPTYKVSDMNGKVVLSATLAETTVGNNAMLLDVSNLRAGIYTITIPTSGSSRVARLVITK